MCLESHKGAKCLQLSCDHIFCRSCLEDFWKLFILEGDVGKVGCPDPVCVKGGREATEEEVARVVTADEVSRWKWLRQKRETDRDPDVIHCPLPFCQTPVPKPKTDEDESRPSGWSRLRTCPSCGFCFCSFCKRTWSVSLLPPTVLILIPRRHGPLSACPMAATETFVLEYIGLPEDSPQRLAIERRYGRTNVQRIVSKYNEDKLNLDWLKSSAMACPGCNVYVQKSAGCNHVRTHF